MATRQELEALLFQALASDNGIEVATTNPQLLRNKLYAVRKKDLNFSCLAFVVPAQKNTLLIIKKPET